MWNAKKSTLKGQNWKIWQSRVLACCNYCTLRKHAGMLNVATKTVMPGDDAFEGV